jgi:hypothetical protein
VFVLLAIFSIRIFHYRFVENYAPPAVLLCLSFILWLLAGIGASFAYMAALAMVIAAFPGKAAITYVITNFCSLRQIRLNAVSQSIPQCGLFLFYGGGTVAGPLLGAVAVDVSET